MDGANDWRLSYTRFSHTMTMTTGRREAKVRGMWQGAFHRTLGLEGLAQ